MEVPVQKKAMQNKAVQILNQVKKIGQGLKFIMQQVQGSSGFLERQQPGPMASCPASLR